MFRNYLAAALRNLVRNKLYAAINIVGLSVGFAAALLIALFARDELTYDRWLPAFERTYRLTGYSIANNIKLSFDLAPFAAVEALKQEIPEIEAITRMISDYTSRSVRRGDREFLETVTWADPNAFDLLQLRGIAGDLHAALADPDGVVLTRSLARKYFDRDAPIGEMVEVGRQYSAHITAVLEDLPSNTHLNLGEIASTLSAHAPEDIRDINRMDSFGHIYLRFVSGDIGRAAVQRLRQGLPAFNDRHPEVQHRRFPFWVEDLVPIADIHLRPATIGAMKPSGSADSAYSALAIAIVIMAVAGFNFVNLTTARATRRAGEIGVRKVSGAMRRQLIAQFIGESVIYTALGMAAAVGLAALMLPLFNGFLQRTIALNFIDDPVLLAAILVTTALVGISAGAYPAFVLSRFSSANVLKKARAQRSRSREALVAAQFAVLIVLALVSVSIHRQVNYATTAALRFDKDQILLINRACLPPLVAEIRTLPGVRDVACTSGGFIGADGAAEIIGPDGTKVRSQMGSLDFDAFELYGLRPVAGRLFSAAFGSDAMPNGEKFVGPGALVINESMSRALGFQRPEEAVGQTLRSKLPFNTNTEHVETASEIVGVVEDFKLLKPQSLREPAAPAIFLVWPWDLQRSGTINVKLAGNEIPETLAAIDGLWKKLGRPRPIERVFLDQTIDDLYREFTRLGQTTGLFAVVAVFISCLGLFGLAAFAAEQRTKEIGVRKALGADKADIVRLMLWEFCRPVLWGSCIAWPGGYFIMRRWLDGFADRIDIGLWMFPAATGLALAIAVVTVIGHALLVARAQPVTALRYE